MCRWRAAEAGAPPLVVKAGVRNTIRENVVYRVYQYIHDHKKLIPDTYTIILGLQFSIVVQQNFINFSHNFCKIFSNFLKIIFKFFKIFINFLIVFKFFKIVKKNFKAAQIFAKFFKLIIIFKNLFLHCPNF